ncbi:hypothetical protein LTS18_005897, partial [Coniosporium uncinatum]
DVDGDDDEEQQQQQQEEGMDASDIDVDISDNENNREFTKAPPPSVTTTTTANPAKKKLPTNSNLNSKPNNKNNTLLTKPPYVAYAAGHPPVWFQPQEVWEMAFADVTLSPTYTAALGLVSQDRGLSLRFPRFLRVREDKGVEEASTSDFLAELYRKQEARAPALGPRKAGEEGEGDGEGTKRGVDDDFEY